jgi:pimeloyl-ACP methyl ester carboxylesterase
MVDFKDIMEQRTILGTQVRISETAGKPLIVLIRAAPVGMNLWEHIWDELATSFTVAAINLPSDWIIDAKDAQSLYSRYSQLIVDIAKALGYERFHYLGWTGGAQIGQRALVEQSEHLLSCILVSPVYDEQELRPAEFSKSVLNHVLDKGDLEFYTRFWLHTSLTPEFVEKNYDHIESVVQQRLALDVARFDTDRVSKWMNFQRARVITFDELDNITIPTLIVASALDGWSHLHQIRRFHARIPTATLAIVPRAGGLGLWEDADSFFAAAGRFLRAAARGEFTNQYHRQSPSACLTYGRGYRLQVEEKAASTAAVFLHGWLMSPAIWDTTIAHLAPSIRCIAPWQPAHGGSTALSEGESLSSWAARIVGMLETMGITRCILVGHSMGGMVAIEAARQLGKLCIGLALVGTPDLAYSDDERRDLQRAADAIAFNWNADVAEIYAELLVGKRFRLATAGWLDSWTREVAGFDLLGMRSLVKAVGMRKDQREVLHTLGIPIWIAHGADDAGVKLCTIQSMAEACPNATLSVYDGVGHCPPLEATEAFAQDCAKFVRFVLALKNQAGSNG